MRISIIIGVLIAQYCIVAIHASTKSVQLFSKNGQLVTSETLVWQSFSSGDPKQFEFAVEAAKFHSEHENYQMYICRVPVSGIFVTGHTQKRDQRTNCIVSLHEEVSTHHQFDVLLNKGNGGKLTWISWSRYTPTIPTGAVSAASTGHVSNFSFLSLSILLFIFYHSMMTTIRWMSNI